MVSPREKLAGTCSSHGRDMVKLNDARMSHQRGPQDDADVDVSAARMRAHARQVTFDSFACSSASRASAICSRSRNGSPVEGAEFPELPFVATVCSDSVAAKAASTVSAKASILILGFLALAFLPPLAAPLDGAPLDGFGAAPACFAFGAMAV